MDSYKTWLSKGLLCLGSIESSLVFLQLSRIQMLRFIINLVENLLMRSHKNFYSPEFWASSFKHKYRHCKIQV